VNGRLGRIVWGLLLLATGMVIGYHAPWTETALFALLLALLIGFSIGLTRLEEQRDKARRQAIFWRQEHKKLTLGSRLDRVSDALREDRRRNPDRYTIHSREDNH
jgi:hypothetical protein